MKIEQFTILKLECQSIKKYRKQVRREATKWEKMFAICVTDKRLVCRMCIELPNVNHVMQNNPIEKWAKEKNMCITKEETEW